MKRCILFLFTMLIMQSVIAIRVTIDGLNYSLITETHDAIISYGNKCIGKLVIPSEVSYNGQTFIVKSMLWKAFFDCPELTKVEIPKTLEDVMHYYPNDPDEGDIETILISSDFMNPFVSCAALESVEVDEENPSMRSVVGVLFSKDGTRLYAYPAGIKATSYVVPQGVEWIGRAAFANANLKKLDLPESVRTICHPTFSGCSLDEVVIRGILDEQSVNSYLFYGLSESAKLYVPASEIERYKSIYPGTVLPLGDYNKDNRQEYFPDGTRWTEIRLDTLKYDSWYSKVGDEWVPNFETIEYYVQGEDTAWDEVYKKVYTNGPEWTDSLAFLLFESGHSVGTAVIDDDYVMYPGATYQFDWSIGMRLWFQDILNANATCFPPCGLYNYGMIDEIKEGDFGGVRPLKYVDLTGKAPIDSEQPWLHYGDTKGGRIIQGIGITEWNDGECLFGPPNPYCALTWSYEDRHYRSMLVHFERDGEVLYNVWPEINEPVTYTKDHMATIILPTSPDASKGKYYRLDRCEKVEGQAKGRIIFERELQPQAHVPYIIVPFEDFSIDLSTLDLAGLSNDTVSIESISFIGTYGRKELNEQEGFYIDIIDTTPDCSPLLGEGQGERLFVGALRAWLQVNWDDPIDHGGAKSPEEKKQIVLKDNGTGIEGNEELRIKNEELNAVYDLSGRSLPGRPRSGLYIEGNRKTVR